MKKYRTLLTALCFLPGIYSPVFAQQKIRNTEAAVTISTQKKLKDTTAIRQQLAIANTITETYTDSSLALVNQAIESSRHLEYNKGMGIGLEQLGILQTLKSNYPASLAAFGSALAYGDSTGGEEANELRVSILGNMASSYWHYGKADSAALYCYEALGDMERLHINSPSVQLHIYTKMLRLWLNLNSDNTEGLAQDKYMQNAVAYLKKAELLNHPDPKMRAKILFSKGALKEAVKEYDSARYFYKAYLALLNDGAVMEGRNISWASATLLNISHTFLLQNQPDSAIWYARQAVADLRTDGGKQFTYFIFSGYYTGKALCQQKKYKEAIAVTLQALATAQQKHVYFMRQMAHEVLAEAYRETGDYKKALEQQLAYFTIKDSLLQKGKIQAITQMEMKYQVVENRKQLAEKELDIIKKNQSIKTKNIWIAIIVSSLMLLLLAASVWYRQNLHRQRMLALQASQKLEIMNLHATINGEEKERTRLAKELHDGIGGMLGAIQMQLGAAVRESNAAGNPRFADVLNLLGEAYSDLRKTAHNLMPETLHHQGLVQAVKLFCGSVSKGGPPVVIFETVGEIPYFSPGTELAVYRIIQELVHNILKHAQADEALVQLTFTNNTLTLTIEDDGIGIDMKNIGNNDGMGIGSIAERVKAMGGKIDIAGSAGKGTSIFIEFTQVEKANNN